MAVSAKAERAKTWKLKPLFKRVVKLAHIAMPEGTAFAYVERGLPTPETEGAYVVECCQNGEVIVLAYIDRYGRVFQTSAPLIAPPAFEPVLTFAQFSVQPSTTQLVGCVQVKQGEGTLDVAQYAEAAGKFTLFDSWFDFSACKKPMGYFETLTRAYLAFVERPKRMKVQVFERGLGSVHEQLSQGTQALPALCRLMSDVMETTVDKAYNPPAIIRLLVRWLHEAGLGRIPESVLSSGAMRLVRTKRYANIYFIAIDSSNPDIPLRAVWAIEAALNRYLLLEQRFGKDASLATEAECAEWDAYHIESVAMQELPENALDACSDLVGTPDGEWEVRRCLATTLEQLKLPYRLDVHFGVNVAEGRVQIKLGSPDGGFMPSRIWDRSAASGVGAWRLATKEERRDQAIRYAIHAGLMLAQHAFKASETISSVEITGTNLGGKPASGMDFNYHVEYERTLFDRAEELEPSLAERAMEGDPLSFFEASGGTFTEAPAEEASPFEQFVVLHDDESVRAFRLYAPECVEDELPEKSRAALGTDCLSGLRIHPERAIRRRAENLADEVTQAESTSDAIKCIREAEQQAREAGDDKWTFACMELMASVTEGTLDFHDPNSVVSALIGPDRCARALERAQALAQKDPAEACRVLTDALTEAAMLDGFVDGSQVVYRAFDSYASRVLYNQMLVAAREDAAQSGADETASAFADEAMGLGFASEGARYEAAAPSVFDRKSMAFAQARADADKRIELVTDSFYLCLLEAAGLLERSFDRTEEALSYAKRAIAVAPTTASGYRQLGRIYMLTGDMASARKALVEGLAVAMLPTDIAMLYYQLGYVMWRMGQPYVGAACYMQSMVVSPSALMQASLELRQLLDETNLPVPEQDSIPGYLEHAGIPVAPLDGVVAICEAATVAATDANLLLPAAELLACRLRYKGDDALMNVLRSMEYYQSGLQ